MFPDLLEVSSQSSFRLERSYFEQCFADPQNSQADLDLALQVDADADPDPACYVKKLDFYL